MDDKTWFWVFSLLICTRTCQEKTKQNKTTTATTKEKKKKKTFSRIRSLSSIQSLSVRLAISLQKFIRWVRNYFLLVISWWLLLMIFFSFMCLGDGLQDELLHHLPRDWGEIDWTVISLILLLAFLEDGSDIYIFLVFEHFSWLPWLRKDYRVASQ